MRGGLERWKRGVDSRGVRHAISYALEGTCDAHLHHTTGVNALEEYSAASDSTVSRFIVDNGVITSGELTAGGLRVWLTGHDPITGEERGHQRLSPDADLLLDGTINHPKLYTIAALLHPQLATEFEALQDRLRERILLTWQAELNARRGHGGLIREEITRIEVVELQHRRSRALDPHIHRHLWLHIQDRRDRRNRQRRPTRLTPIGANRGQSRAPDHGVVRGARRLRSERGGAAADRSARVGGVAPEQAE